MSQSSVGHVGSYLLKKVDWMIDLPFGPARDRVLVQQLTKGITMRRRRRGQVSFDFVEINGRGDVPNPVIGCTSGRVGEHAVRLWQRIASRLMWHAVNELPRAHGQAGAVRRRCCARLPNVQHAAIVWFLTQEMVPTYIHWLRLVRRGKDQLEKAPVVLCHRANTDFR